MKLFVKQSSSEDKALFKASEDCSHNLGYLYCKVREKGCTDL